MKENNMNFGPTPESDKEPEKNLKESKYQIPTKEQEEEYEQWLKDHPYEEIPMEMRRDCEKEKGEVITLFNRYEKVHDLKELHSITDFPIEDTEKNEKWTNAKNDLYPIVALLNALNDETNIDKIEYEKLKAGYKILSRAVGMVNAGKIDHTR